MKTVYDALDPIVNASISEREKGAKYEAACVWYLANDPFWASFFDRVETLEQALSWEDCPVHDTQDTGIDLIARERDEGAWWAIQCKCHDAEKPLPKGVCDSFFARALGDPAIGRYMVMTTAKGLARNLQQQVENTGAMVVDTAKMAVSGLDWGPFIEGAEGAERVTYDVRPHQREAIDGIEAAFLEHDRCKAIMACGTGKTLMALRLAEEYLGGRGTVLFCAPSISLVGQSMREWLSQSRVPLAPLVVCSDAKASRVEDAIPMTLDCFEYPATTRPDRLWAAWAASRRDDGLTVVFSTYQSIDVIRDAQSMGLPEFDLIVCDEAHRTTGNALPGVPKTEASAFMKVHYDENVRARKRLYMTATPRIYGETAKRRGAEEDYTIASMDDESIYGPTAYQIKFGEAVEKKLLTDYKVVVLTVEEDALRGRMPAIDDEGVDALSLDADDIGKIIGCWKGLAEHGENAPVDALGLGEMLVVDDMNAAPDYEVLPLHRAVGFCSTIAASKTICEAFGRIVDDYIGMGGDDFQLRCVLDHVDGAMNSADRNRKLAWLGGEVPEDECRILTNARCLAEGIDVPSLDAVIFFNAKNSTVDVVQAVGRVMRRAEGKEFGYIILPIFVPSGMTPEEALDDNKVFANVWSILQALRSHDERIEARVNALALEQRAAKRGPDPDADRHKGWDDGLLSAKEAEQLRAAEIAEGVQMRLSLFPVERWEKAVRAVVVKKCGTRIYWDAWAEDVARIAQRHVERIGELVEGDGRVRGEFEVFLGGLRDSLNPGISEQDAVEMIAQHMITMPVFDALFGDFEFAKSNPVSVAIERFLAVLGEHRVGEASDAAVLDDVYDSVRRRAAMVRTDTARQQLIRDLYEQFFKVAFEKTSQKMGVVYTPTEVIDYILRETDRVLRREFGKSLSDEGVHVLDPFAGTGSFMAHLIESDIIPDERLEWKYRHEMHSNEILLLAYYIMTVNVEYAYHERMGGEYVPFEGGVLTDTFQMTEAGDTLDERVFSENSERVLRQNSLPIRVIVGNPPYSAKQESANDNNQNEDYPTLDARIAATYATRTGATNKNSLYDSYIRAFRWASDRIGEQGIVCFVSNAGWLRGAAMNGLRRCLVDEFDDVYVFDLRGNQRTQGEESRREGGKVFGSGSRTPVSITLLLRHAGTEHAGRIHYHDVGDYLTREEKLDIVRAAAVSGDVEWTTICPDRYGDWIDQRDDTFYEFAPMGIEKLRIPSGIFEIWSRGLGTYRDAWTWGYSRKAVRSNMSRLISETNSEIAASRSEGRGVVYDAKRFSWTRRLEDFAKKGMAIDYDACRIVAGMYRPFCRQWVYYDRVMNEMTYQQPRLFPIAEGDRAKGPTNNPIPGSPADNLSTSGETGKAGEMTYQQQPCSKYYPNFVIQITGVANEFSCLMTNYLPDLNAMKGGSQCFPIWWYEKERRVGGLFENESSGRVVRRDAITNEALAVFLKAYPHAFLRRYKKDGGEELNKEDIFYYVYGILHSPEYRKRFESNLKKELPRIPLAEDFAAFSRAGRALAELHLNYETVKPWPSIVEDGDSADPGRTVKMRFGKCKKNDENPKGIDRTVLHVSENLTLREIPEEAYDYVVNGRSAIEWLMDRYQVRTDKASGIVNDPNEYSDNPRYIVDLVKSIVTVSMETLEIVSSLPPLNEKPQPDNWPLAWRAQK